MRSARKSICARNGWLKLFRYDESFAANARERAVAKDFGLSHQTMDVDGARQLEPSLSPVFRHAVHLGRSCKHLQSARGDARLCDAVRRAGRRDRCPAMRARFTAAKGAGVSIRKPDTSMRIRLSLRLGRGRRMCLGPLGIKLPLGLKRGYHRHYTPQGNASLARPVLDADGGYVLAPMEQGIRLTTGAEFAPRDAPPTPVQFDRLMPSAKELFPLGEPVEKEPWMGSRPCFADSASGDRPCAGADRPVARLWSRPLGPDARTCHGASACRNDDRRDTVHRPRALSCGTVCLIIETYRDTLAARP